MAHYLEYGVVATIFTGKAATAEEQNNFNKAVRLYRQAAAQNDAFAMEALCASRGFIVPVPAETSTWCEAANRDPAYGTMHATEAEKRLATKALLEDSNFPSLAPAAR